jgi:O-acetylhomoserine/O-acetylserine sulfhydrylase-like pyridoxal-dependent enzyme
MSSTNCSMRQATLCIHGGTHREETTGGACSPIHTSTAFAFPNAAAANIYPRYFNTPNQRLIGQKLAALEKGEAAVVLGPGMAAITTLLFAHLRERAGRLSPGHARAEPERRGKSCLRPSRTSYRQLSREERERAGISDGLIRVSVGGRGLRGLGGRFCPCAGGRRLRLT